MGQPLHPVIIGVGQCTYRDADPARTPIEGMIDSARLALADTGCPAVAATIDCVVSIPFLARQVLELAGLFTENAGSGVAEGLGIAPATLLTSDYGGNLPQWFVNRCADELVRGEHRAVLLTGCELMATLFSGLRNGADFSAWQRGGARESLDLGLGRDPCLPSERAHGLFEPINTYPLFQSALRHAHGWSEDAQGERLGGLISRMSAVAATNPLAWKRNALSPAEVLSTDAGNRVITSPYTKAMNAILAVDMAASVILTTDTHALSLGVAPEHMVYLQAGAEASDVRYTAERVDLHRSPALAGCVSQTLDMAGVTTADIDCFDLYSCFPSAVEVACDALGLSSGDARGVTVTGGMTRFGGPGNNYSMHAIAALCERLREGRGGRGLVSANGGYLTKHAVGLYGSTSPRVPWAERAGDRIQARLDKDAHPALNAKPAPGRLVVEAHAVPFKGGAPAHGLVLGRLDDGRRCLAHAVDAASCAALLHGDCVGREGQVESGAPVNTFRLA
ncbi:MAG: acetyl-CoA acetyltransferase [Chromatocurvus sp.]